MMDLEPNKPKGAFLRFTRMLVMAGLVLPLAALTHAEVTLDGTLGPRDSVTGPHYQIPDTAGRTVGSNLFHSFGVFNIDTGESATFTGPAAIDNVISRVTGGSRSFIDGPLRSEIGSANFWFTNPSGHYYQTRIRLIEAEILELIVAPIGPQGVTDQSCKLSPGTR